MSLKRRADDLENASYSQKCNDLEEENEGEISHFKEMTQRVKREKNSYEEEEDLKLIQRARLGELSPEILKGHRRSSKKSVQREETQDAMEAHSQSIIRQTIRNNSKYSMKRQNKVLIDKSVVPNTIYDPNKLINLIQSKNKENQMSCFETKVRNKNLSNIITKDKDEILETIDFNESLLIINLFWNASSNMSDISVLKCKVVNKNIRDDSVQYSKKNLIKEENYVNEIHIYQNFWNSKELKIIVYSKDNPWTVDQTLKFAHGRNNKTANDNIIKDPGVCHLLGGKSKKPEKELLCLEEIIDNQRSLIMADIKRGSQHITEADRMMKFQHRMGRRILEDSANKNQNLYENHSKFYKRGHKIDRFGKLLKRSQKKEKDENIEDNQGEELGKLSAAQNEKLDIRDYEDKEKEDSVHNYNHEEDETEDYGI